MTDEKITDLTAIAGANLADGDEFVVVDVSDATMDATGTTKKITRAEASSGLSLSAVGAPSDANGADGGFYYQLDADGDAVVAIWGPKASGAWPAFGQPTGRNDRVFLPISPSTFSGGTSAALFTATVPTFFNLGFVSITTAFDGTTPRLDYFVDLGSAGLLAGAGNTPNDLTHANSVDPTSGVTVVNNSDVFSPTGTFVILQPSQTLYVVASQDGTPSGTPIDSTVGAALVVVDLMPLENAVAAGPNASLDSLNNVSGLDAAADGAVAVKAGGQWVPVAGSPSNGDTIRWNAGGSAWAFGA